MRAALAFFVFSVTSITALPSSHAAPQRRTIYLNRGGGTYISNNNMIDSTTNNTNIVQHQTTATLPPASLAPSEWTAVRACIDEQFAPYSVEITETDPGVHDHIEVAIGGRWTDLDPQILGGTPPDTLLAVGNGTSCGTGKPNDRGITFVFVETIKEDHPSDYVQRICELATLEAARQLTLAFHYDCNSVMSVREDCPAGQKRTFQSTPIDCGTLAAVPCRCSLAPQENSNDRLLNIVGPADHVPPVVSVTEPADGATVPIGFSVKAHATDDIGVTRVDLYVDGVFAAGDSAFEDFTIATPANIALGAHTLEVRAFDNGANVTTASISVTVEGECTTTADCGDGEVCQAGACLSDFGVPCTAADACASGLCASTFVGKICTVVCEGPDAVACPAGSSCQAVDGGGLDKCTPDTSSGGCRTSSGRARHVPFALAALAALGLTITGMRRRRRPH